MKPGRTDWRIHRAPALLAAAAVRFYQRWISPVKFMLFGPGAGCRFYPTCSQYALEAFLTHGFLKGGWLATRRLLKCHPFHPGGVDLTPSKRTEGCAECPGDGRNSPNG